MSQDTTNNNDNDKGIFPFSLPTLPKFPVLTPRESKRLMLNCIAIALSAITYNILRVNKDLLIGMEPDQASLIPFIKGTFVLFLALGLSSVYPYLATNLKRREFLALMVLVPGLYFLGHYILLRDQLDALHTGGIFANAVKELFSNDIFAWIKPITSYFEVIASLIDIWPTTIYYTLAELWGMLGFAILFYLHASESANAKTQATCNFIYIIAAQASSFVGNATLAYLSTTMPKAGIIGLGTGISVVGLFIFYLVMDQVVSDCIDDPLLPKYKNERTIDAKNADLFRAIKDIIDNKSVFLFTSVIVLYGAAMTMVEQVAKSYVFGWFGEDTSALANFQYLCMTAQSFFAILLAVYGASMADKQSWINTALVTPLTLLVLGSCIVGAEWIQVILGGFITLPLFKLCVGALQPVVTKIAKYVAFDNTRESYVFAAPEQEKIEMRNAGDILGSRSGKALGSFFNSGCISYFKSQGFAGPESLQMSTPYIGVAFVIAIALIIDSYQKMAAIYSDRVAGNPVTPNADNSTSVDTEDVIDIESVIADIEERTSNDAEDTVVESVLEEEVDDVEIEVDLDE